MKQLSRYSADLSESIEGELTYQSLSIGFIWQRPICCCDNKRTCLDICKCSDIRRSDKLEQEDCFTSPHILSLGGGLLFTDREFVLCRNIDEYKVTPAHDPIFVAE